MLFVREVQEAVNLSDELSNLSLSHIRRGSFDCGYPAAQSDSLHLRRLPRIQSKGLARAVSRCRVPRPSKRSVSQPSHRFAFWVLNPSQQDAHLEFGLHAAISL